LFFFIIFLFLDAFVFLKSLTGTPSLTFVIPKNVSSKPKINIGGPDGVTGAIELLEGEKLINLAL